MKSHVNREHVREGSAKLPPHPEFAGTLLGFDDYVSMSLLLSSIAAYNVK